MQVHFGTGSLHPEWARSVACIGTFDGVHLGHAAVISRAVATARAAELPCVLVTFDRHPACVLSPERAPGALAGLETNLARFRALGVSAVVVLHFDEALSHMPAQAFLDQILREGVRAEQLVVGHDFAMGRDRVGSTDWLAERIPTEVVPAFMVDGERVSSRAIRTSVESGDMARATEFLGRPYALEGVIVSGQRLGRQLGYPTANLARSFHQVLPIDGVYAGWFTSERGRYRCATAIGTRPAVGGGARTIESFLIDYPGDSLYGLSVQVEFHRRLREERNFPNLDALKVQMALDVAEAATLSSANF